MLHPDGVVGMGAVELEVRQQLRLDALQQQGQIGLGPGLLHAPALLQWQQHTP